VLSYRNSRQKKSSEELLGAPLRDFFAFSEITKDVFEGSNIFSFY